MTEQPQETWQNAALKEARHIGDMLKERYNIQPAAIPKRGDDGMISVNYSPPPSFCDISLRDIGKQTQVY